LKRRKLAIELFDWDSLMAILFVSCLLVGVSSHLGVIAQYTVINNTDPRDVEVMSGSKRKRCAGGRHDRKKSRTNRLDVHVPFTNSKAGTNWSPTW